MARSVNSRPNPLRGNGWATPAPNSFGIRSEGTEFAQPMAWVADGVFDRRARAARSNRVDEDLAVLRAIRRPHQPAALHRLDDARGAVVAERELALEPRRRAAPRLGHDANGVVVGGIGLAVVLGFGGG